PGLGQQRHDQVDLVVAGGGHHDIAARQVGLLEAGQLAGVGEHPFGVRHPRRHELARIALDQHDLVAIVDQLLGDGAATVARAGDRDLHHCAPSGGAPVTFVTPATMSSVTSMNTWSPSCTRVDAVGSVPMPKRIRYATRAPLASSNARRGRPTHPAWTGTSMIDTELVGSRHSSAAFSATRWRSIRSAVQRTVATVGMP